MQNSETEQESAVSFAQVFVYNLQRDELPIKLVYSFRYAALLSVYQTVAFDDESKFKVIESLVLSF